MSGPDVFGPVLMGLIIVGLGIANCRGHIGSIHWYHRRRGKEEDIGAFGKRTGLGTIIAGAQLVLYGALCSLLPGGVGIALGGAVLLCGLAAGLGIRLYAIIKSNKGLF